MYHKTVLSNGVRVVTEKMPGVRSLSIGVLIETGSGNEQDGLSGISHCIEHLLFKGTSTRDASTLARMVDMAGGQLGAFTTRDYTCLFASVLDDYRTYALDIFGDVLLHPLFDEEHLSREIRVISQEISAGDERPDKLVQELLKQSVWPNHPLGHNIYGGKNTIANFSRKQILNYFRDYYGAERVIITAAGNLDHDDFVAQVNDAFWALPVSKRPLNGLHTTSPEFQPGLILRERASPNVYFALGAPAPNYNSANRYAVYVLNSLLGNGMSSRLYQQIRDEQGLVYDIGSNYHPYRAAGLIIVEGVTTNENFLPVVHGIISTLASLATRPVGEEELWRAQERLRAEVLLGAESSNIRMSQLGTQEIYFGSYIPLDEVVAAIRAISPEDITQIAAELFQPGNLGLAAIGAFENTPGLAEYLEGLIGLD